MQPIRTSRCPLRGDASLRFSRFVLRYCTPFILQPFEWPFDGMCVRCHAPTFRCTHLPIDELDANLQATPGRSLRLVHLPSTDYADSTGFATPHRGIGIKCKETIGSWCSSVGTSVPEGGSLLRLIVWKGLVKRLLRLLRFPVKRFCYFAVSIRFLAVGAS